MIDNLSQIQLLSIRYMACIFFGKTFIFFRKNREKVKGNSVVGIIFLPKKVLPKKILPPIYS
jgi:hypothetical protein